MVGHGSGRRYWAQQRDRTRRPSDYFIRQFEWFTQKFVCLVARFRMLCEKMHLVWPVVAPTIRTDVS